MRAGRLAALLIPLLLVGFGSAGPEAGPAGPLSASHSLQLAEAETGGGEHSAPDETTDDTRDDTRDETRNEASDDDAGIQPDEVDDDAGGNWLAWLVGLPLLAGLILLFLLLTRGKRPGSDSGANE